MYVSKRNHINFFNENTTRCFRFWHIKLNQAKAHTSCSSLNENKRKRNPQTVIYISGETSSGKSTLINTILGKKIFKTRNRESTSTICKLRNSKTIRIIAERISGETSLTELDCDPETEDGEKKIRKILKGLTDVTAQSDSKMNNCVDIGLPIPLLTVLSIFMYCLG